VAVAVEAALRELLASAELQRRLHPEPAARPGLLRRAAAALGRGLVSVARGCWGWLSTMPARSRDRAVEAIGALHEGSKALTAQVRRGMSNLGRRLWFGAAMAWSLASRFRKPLLIAVASGTLLGVGCYYAGPTIASVVSGFAGFMGSLVGSALNRLRKALAQDDLEDWCYSRVR
jgi:hypothetical protein